MMHQTPETVCKAHSINTETLKTFFEVQGTPVKPGQELNMQQRMLLVQHLTALKAGQIPEKADPSKQDSQKTQSLQSATNSTLSNHQNTTPPNRRVRKRIPIDNSEIFLPRTNQAGISNPPSIRVQNVVKEEPAPIANLEEATDTKPSVQRPSSAAEIVQPLLEINQQAVPSPATQPTTAPAAAHPAQDTPELLNKIWHHSSSQQERLTALYHKCFSVFTGTGSLVEKAREFRIILEEGFRKITGQEEASLHDNMLAFFEDKTDKQTRNDTFRLKQQLNPWHHPYSGEPTETQVKAHLNTLVNVFFKITNVPPPQKLKVLLRWEPDMTATEGLNDQQKAAVLCDTPIVFVNAGPGTGKTHLITHKIIHLIKTVDNPKIAALSYTNSAADELGSKIAAKMPAWTLEKAYTLFNGTIHAFALKSLLQYWKETKPDETAKTIADEDDIEAIAEILVAAMADKHTLTANYVKQIMLKDESINFDWPIHNEIYFMANTLKSKLGVFSFLDVLDTFNKEIEKEPAFRQWLSARVDHFIVDEAQDLSSEQYRLIKLLYKYCNIRIFLVGDPRQSIFRFSGGSFLHLLDFVKDKKEEYSEIVLTQSYRCPPEIFNLANSFNFIDCKNYALKSDKPANENAFLIEQTSDQVTEAKKAVEAIRHFGVFNETAVIYRQAGYLHHIARELNTANIPFRILGGRKFIKSYIRLYLNIFKFQTNPNNYLAFRQLLEYLQLPVPKNDTFELLGNTQKLDLLLSKQIGEPASSESDLVTDKDTLQLAACIHSYLNLTQNTQLPFDKSAKLLVDSTHSLLQKHVVRYDLLRRKKDMVTIEQMTDDIYAFRKAVDGIDNFSNFQLAISPTDTAFSRFYRKELSIESTADQAAKDKVTLATIHSAKGLEWPLVIIPGMGSGLFPNDYFASKKQTEDEKNLYYSDELKMLYVAITRAQERLLITYPLKYYNNGHGPFQSTMSRFLNKQYHEERRMPI